MRDLIVLAADKCMEFTLRGLLSRPQSLGMRPISVDFITHPGRDGGTRTSGANTVALRRRDFNHALIVLDYEGSGSPLQSEELEEELDHKLKRDWDRRGKAIVIEPELDVWMWGSDNALSPLVGWQGQPHSIRSWIEKQGFMLKDNGKPARPKEALEALLRECHLPRSASNYQKIAQTLSLNRCGDAAFGRLRNQLQNWFPSD